MNHLPERIERVTLRPMQQAKLAIQSALQPTTMERLKAFVQRHVLFVLVVAVPVLIASFYYAFVASDIYVTEVKYVVRTPSDSKAGGLGNIVQTSGMSKSTDDAHAINAYFLSREAMETLRKEVGLDQAYSSPGIDVLSRFPSPFQKFTNEAMFKYYLSMTAVKYDKTTGISTLSVSAFDPSATQRIVKRLMVSGEALANSLTKRMRESLVSSANSEAEDARRRAYEAQNKITAWRNREAQVDPTKYAVAIIEVIARLSLELVQIKAQISETQALSPNNPTIASQMTRIRALEAQIASERKALAGGTASLAPKIVEFEQLQLERQFAEKLFAAAVASQESARNEAQKQQIYVEWIAEPHLPDYPYRPLRFFSVLSVAGICFLIFLILNKVLMNIARHGAFGKYFSKTQR